jgi:hypothetical protein
MTAMDSLCRRNAVASRSSNAARSSTLVWRQALKACAVRCKASVCCAASANGYWAMISPLNGDWEIAYWLMTGSG